MAAELLLLERAPSLLPTRVPGSGEQYRFHFDMAKCIGCKCCVVACNEQNGNPAELNWRRVGEIEGGVYPFAQRWHVSMACNHCLEPSCLIGCPVKAYTKDSLTGIVDHDADLCIGCQYCVWNCSYEVPQFNPERGVVGKCDMCHGRMEQGLSPACVQACPEGAIEIEIVNAAAWRANYSGADAPGLPSAADSISTTRLTLPSSLAHDADRVDRERVRRPDPHWSLICLLVLSQVAVGAVGTLWLLGLPGSLASALAAAMAMAVAPLHLGRPIHAGRAIANWRHSWLSREVLTLSVFGATAGALPFAPSLAPAAIAAGLLCVFCSARIYMVPARPAWNLKFTVAEFYLTCAVLGPRLVMALGLAGGNGLIVCAVAATVLQAANGFVRIAKLSGSPVPEMRASARLMRGPVLAARLLCAVLAVAMTPVSPVPAFVFALASETLGRYLFFTSAVPKSIASTYLTPKGAAA